MSVSSLKLGGGAGKLTRPSSLLPSSSALLALLLISSLRYLDSPILRSPQENIVRSLHTNSQSGEDSKDGSIDLGFCIPWNAVTGDFWHFVVLA